MVIRGAAGSGKTTTAILRLRALLSSFTNRRNRLRQQEPVRALVLTYNRTLKGYIEDLVEKTRREADDPDAVELEVSTFGKWGQVRLGGPPLVANDEREGVIRDFGQAIPLDADFLVNETEYVLGRFLPDDLPKYLTATRHGRGAAPRVEQAVRQSILADVIANYDGWKQAQGVVDWNDVAVRLALAKTQPLYDIIIADECQDFTGNQLRAIHNHLKADHSLTLIIDSAQRIYARGFTWRELGIPVRAENIKTLSVNYRNTREIAQFALPLITGIPHDEDATLPDFRMVTRSGPRPVMLSGRFSRQMAWAIRYIKDEVDLTNESVAFLHPKGGGWFSYVKAELQRAKLPYEELTQRADWPSGPANIGLATCHSAKGLEFDHVFILGLNDECLDFLDGDDDREAQHRRLIAMAIGRAKKFVCLGHRPHDPSSILAHLDSTTCDLVDL